MDVLKDIAALPLKVLFSNPLVCVLVLIGTTALLWLPASWLGPMGLDLLREEYRMWIGLVWGGYLLAVVYHVAVRLGQWGKDSSRVRAEEGKMRGRLEQLTPGQKVVLTRFIEGNRSYLDLPTNSDDVRELLASGILVSGYVYNVDPDFDSYGTYRLADWARRYVMENHEAIELGLGEMEVVDKRLWGERRSGY